MHRRSFFAVVGGTLVAACADGSIGQSGRADGGSVMNPVPDPVAVRITRWRADPYAFGSYSYLPVGVTPDVREALAAPVGDRLFFAGEATDSAFPATVHGALRSGRRAAQDILRLDTVGTVLVVGAGMAGLGCARALRQAGIEVLVVEARDRLGGRTWSDDALGVTVDLGASWIHQTDGNPLSDLADAAGAERIPTDYENVVVRGPDGSEVDVDLDDERLLAGIDDAGPGLSVRDALRLAGEADPDLAAPAMELLTVLAIENEYGADAEDLSVLALLEGEELDGPDVVFPGGYVQLVDALANGLDIETGVVVDHIRVTDENVAVMAGASVRHADHVVVTVPLGVLQRGAIIFEPPLPPTMQDGITALGMGLLDKVFLRFEERFWDDATVIAWQNPVRGEWSVWFDQTAVTGVPTLLGFHAGSVAERIEERSDDEIVAGAMAALRTMYER